MISPPIAERHEASPSMPGVLQDLLGHLPHHRVKHQKEWFGDTMQMEHINSEQLKKDPWKSKKIRTCSMNLPIPVCVIPRPPKTWTASRAVS